MKDVLPVSNNGIRKLGAGMATILKCGIGVTNFINMVRG